MVEVGQRGFFVEGPIDEYGNRGFSPFVIEGEVVEGGYPGALAIQVTAPPEFTSKWDYIPYAHTWVPTEGPARMITREERVQLAAGGVALPATE